MEKKELTEDKEELTEDKEELTEDKEELTEDKEELTEDKEELTEDKTDTTFDYKVVISLLESINTSLIDLTSVSRETEINSNTDTNIFDDEDEKEIDELDIF